MLTARGDWWGWAVPGLVLILMCAWPSGGSLDRVQAGEGEPFPALLPTQGDLPDGFDGRRDTLHFVLLWRQGETTREEIDAAAAQAEALFARLSAELGPVRTPEARLILLFEGDGLSPTGQLQLTHNDNIGRIHLFRYPGPGRGYVSKLGHELVHAFRLDWQRRHRRDPGYGFVEEGFAELMAIRLEPDTLPFPYYGVPRPVVVGQWLLANEAPPLLTLLERHGWLNRHCLLQAYALRGSFFLYLSETFGQDTVLRLAYTEERVTPALFGQIFGRDFETLAAAWRAQALRQFWAVPEAPQLAHDYRTKTPAARSYVCQAG
ncbi:MAG TPA: hypothetical protein VHN78_01515, partial [Chloroflexota bacterium]|nr:hypothetical protein [Chloroflexota bacterium]